MFPNRSRQFGLSPERLQQIRSAGLGAPRSIVEHKDLSRLAWGMIAEQMLSAQRAGRRVSA